MRHLSTAMRFADRALTLSPNDLDAVAGKALIYLAEGRLKDASEVLARASVSSTGLPPESLTITAWRVRFISRDYAGAIALLRPLLKPSSPANLDYRTVYWNLLGLAQQHAGNAPAAHEAFAHALAGVQQMLARNDKDDQVARADYQGILSWAEAGLGHRRAALDAANRAVELMSANRDLAAGSFNQVSRAWVEAWVGDRGAAIAALPHLLQVADPAHVSRPLLRLDPMWDPLRKDPRFQALIASADSADARD
jgi:serine/threonine-protein kinase